MRESRTPRAPAGRPERRYSADSATLEEQCHPRKIFVGGLAHRTTTQQLRDHFSSFGPVVDAVVLRWPDGRSRGFGYATFADAAAASAALGQTHQIGGREVDVKRAVPGTNKLFVGGLPQNTTAGELRDYFEKFGVVSDAVVMIDPATNRSRGFGFICYLPGQDGATAVASALAEYERHRIRGKWIEVKSAAPPHKLTPKDSNGDASTPGLTTEDASTESDAGESATSSALVSTEAEELQNPGGEAFGRPSARPPAVRPGTGAFADRKKKPPTSLAPGAGRPKPTQGGELMEPKKVHLPGRSGSLPQPPAAAPGVESAAVGSTEAQVWNLQQQLLLLQRQQQQQHQQLWLQANAAAAVAAAQGTVGSPWPGALFGNIASAPGLGASQDTDEACARPSSYATPEFQNTLEQFLRLSMPAAV